MSSTSEPLRGALSGPCPRRSRCVSISAHDGLEVGSTSGHRSVLSCGQICTRERAQGETSRQFAVKSLWKFPVFQGFSVWLVVIAPLESSRFGGFGTWKFHPSHANLAVAARRWSPGRALHPRVFARGARGEGRSWWDCLFSWSVLFWGFGFTPL